MKATSGFERSVKLPVRVQHQLDREPAAVMVWSADGSLLIVKDFANPKTFIVDSPSLDYSNVQSFKWIAVDELGTYPAI